MSSDMAVEIDKKECDGCGICVEICPPGLFKNG